MKTNSLNIDHVGNGFIVTEIEEDEIVNQTVHESGYRIWDILTKWTDRMEKIDAKPAPAKPAAPAVEDEIPF